MADQIIKDLTESTSPTAETLVEIQHPLETSTKKMKLSNLVSLEATARAAMDDAIIAGAGLAEDGSCVFSGTYYLDSFTDIKSAIEYMDTKVRSVEQAVVSGGDVIVVEIELDAQDLSQLNTYPVDLLTFGTLPAGASYVFMPISAVMILYQQGNALSYGVDVYIGYNNGSDPALTSDNYIWKIPQAFIEDSSGDNIACLPQYLPGAGYKLARVSDDIILWASADHGGATITSTAKIVIAYKTIEVTPETSGA